LGHIGVDARAAVPVLNHSLDEARISLGRGLTRQ
jgi:hypothetical protein